jgi:hypothetical protein
MRMAEPAQQSTPRTHAGLMFEPPAVVPVYVPSSKVSFVLKTCVTEQNAWQRPGWGPAPSASQHESAPQSALLEQLLQDPLRHARPPGQSDEPQHAAPA